MDGSDFLLLFLLANVLAFLGTALFAVAAEAVERRWHGPRRRR